MKREETPILQKVRRRFADNRFALHTGIEILEAEEGRSLCRLQLQPHHMNANHTPMGGAIFTLADLAFAVAANAGSEKTVVSQQMSVTFLSPARGAVLLAEGRRIRHGRRTCLYEVTVRDELGTLVAHLTGNGFPVD